MDDPRSKKRRKTHAAPAAAGTPVDTSKPSAVFQPTHAPRTRTLSIALPASILANAQSLDLKTQLAGSIARAAAVACVDEIVIFSDSPSPSSSRKDNATSKNDGPTDLLVHILSYLETPQYLRKHLFPIHPNLSKAGTLAPLDIPSHLRADESCLYREAVALEPAPDSSGGTLLDAGLKRRVKVAEEIPAWSRVTVRFPSATTTSTSTSTASSSSASGSEYVPATPVSPDAPRLESGYYWGYTVRTCGSLSAVFTECPFAGGYDVTVGTSERGEDVDGVAWPARRGEHVLVAFGGLAGLERALEADGELKGAGVTEVSECFDYWVNVMAAQGSRTIRTEEAVWIALSRLRGKV